MHKRLPFHKFFANLNLSYEAILKLSETSKCRRTFRLNFGSKMNVGNCLCLPSKFQYRYFHQFAWQMTTAEKYCKFKLIEYECVNMRLFWSGDVCTYGQYALELYIPFFLFRLFQIPNNICILCALNGYETINLRSKIHSVSHTISDDKGSEKIILF